MNKFTTISGAINHVADVTGLDTDGATWVYENSDCPSWDDEDFASYDFLADECVNDLPDEFVKCNRKASKFTNFDSAINHIADAMALDTDGAEWVYFNSDCPSWDDEDFASYDFLADECVNDLPEEFVK